MEKADRDPIQAFRADDECRQLLVQFPNSKYAPEAQQKLRNIQEVLAEHEFRVAHFYYNKGSNPAAANRFAGLVDSYPLYSGADEALWEQADSFLSQDGRPLRRFSAGHVACAHREGLSAERARRRRQGRPEVDEAAGSGGRSGGVRADEVRIGKPERPE